MTEATIRRAPDFTRLVAQFSLSVHKLHSELGASNAPFGREHVRSLAHGALLSVSALRRAAPSELTALLDEAESALQRITHALATSPAEPDGE